MSLNFITGNPLETDCDTLAISYNAKGRTEVEDISMQMLRAFPVAFATYLRRCRQEKQKGGDIFLWLESKPKLLILTVRDSNVGATRLRHVQKSLMTIARDYKLYGIKSLAFAPIGNVYEYPEIRRLYQTWFAKSTLPVAVYENVKNNPTQEHGEN